MSVAKLCTGDVVVVQTRSATVSVGAAGGDARTWSNGVTLDCNVQTNSSGESGAFANRGLSTRHTVYFSADPGVTNNDVLKWTVRASTVLSVPIYLRVIGVMQSGRPGKAVIWIVDVTQETGRPEL